MIYRKRSSWLQSLVKSIKAVRLRVDREPRSSDFTEQPRCLINTIFTHVHVLLTHALRTTL